MSPVFPGCSGGASSSQTYEEARGIWKCVATFLTATVTGEGYWHLQPEASGAKLTVVLRVQ